LKPATDKPLFLRACHGEPVERTPIWIMRQAGRYLPAYRATRAKTDFQTLYRTPALAAEVTVQPVEILGFDAAIIFSDILVVPEAMGMALEFHEGSGPRFLHPLRRAEDLKKLRRVEVAAHLDYVLAALQLTKQKLAGAAPLIGFCGSPWTLATYMIEGHGSKNFVHAKTMLYQQPQLLHDLLARLTETLQDYLSAQLQAGAEAVQIFDSWGDALTPQAYEEFSLRYIKQLIAGLKREPQPAEVAQASLPADKMSALRSSQITDALQPVIYFLRGRGNGLSHLAHSGANVLGLDWSIDLAEARKQTENRIPLQGNLDPCVLFAHPAVIRAEAWKVLDKMRGSAGHVFNLGHGILPETPVENVKALIQAVREYGK
jgi:uroporphyrinogen decarboxylase